MITFIDFMDKQKLKYNKMMFMSDDKMYRAKIINQHLRKFKTYCNQHPDVANDTKRYEDEVWEYEFKNNMQKKQ